MPTFSPNEQSLNPKEFSDFNDLANYSKPGIEGAKRQLKPEVEKITKQYVRLRH
ncbi:hypothetical protein [Legionella sainthelensi]|uniref:hypothetical protein n=1 Tax=Legionella sainthelensi TaxID=28087 RepID=UPI0013E30A91|nr:hypothetical protein [Legionella sainthelensi]